MMMTQDMIKNYLDIIRKYPDTEKDIEKIFGREKGEKLLWALGKLCDARMKAEDFKMDILFNKKYPGEYEFRGSL